MQPTIMEGRPWCEAFAGGEKGFRILPAFQDYGEDERSRENARVHNESCKEETENLMSLRKKTTSGLNQ